MGNAVVMINFSGLITLLMWEIGAVVLACVATRSMPWELVVTRRQRDD
jgi:hypothetical protein